ncbi:MAG: hypothetical protein KA369_20645 [Spirochaetes bacterium]|nr:hypothetical protein [Spirochaetota bacterium]
MKKFKVDADKIIDATAKKMEDGAVRISNILRKARNILLLLFAAIAGIYLIKNENTRIWGIVVFLLAFAWLYSYVVKRRGTRKK